MMIHWWLVGLNDRVAAHTFAEFYRELGGNRWVEPVLGAERMDMKIAKPLGSRREVLLVCRTFSIIKWCQIHMSCMELLTLNNYVDFFFKLG
jgi:hypothetical protein